MDTHVVRQEAVDPVDLPSVARGLSGTPVALTVNGTGPVVDLEPRVSLLDALREHLELTSSKKGGDQGRRQPCQPAGCRPGCPRCAPARPVARSAGMTVYVATALPLPTHGWQPMGVRPPVGGRLTVPSGAPEDGLLRLGR
jgi:hypothetical protein